MDQPGTSRRAQEKRNALTKAIYFLRAKARCKTRFSCFLDEHPSELIPRPARSTPRPPVDDVELMVNSRFHYQPNGGLPAEIRDPRPPLDGLLDGYPVAWIEDIGTDLWLPFWARGEWAEALVQLSPGRPAPVSLPTSVRHGLVMADVLVPQGYEEARRKRWEATFRAARHQFQTESYTIVRDLIHPLQLGAMRGYYRTLVADGRLPVGDDQVAERYRLHSELVASFLHPQLASIVARIAGEPVKPSYVYFASYPAGSLLPPHQDRVQCEFSVSLLVDYVPEPDGPCGWPLFLENPDVPGAVVAADLGLGDGVFYRGRQLVHYRDKLADGHTSTSLFFHYVREDYEGDLS
jgi:hypothetical protein